MLFDLSRETIAVGLAAAMTIGFLLGYSVRSIVEHARRRRFMRERGW